jgi:1-deoxy-D-xylulose-5-phosphate synthase
MAERYSRIVVIEDGVRSGGIASSLGDSFRDQNISTPIHSIGVPLVFIEHSKRNQILEDLGITAQSVARQLVSWFSGSVTQEVTRLQADESADRKPLR